MDQAESVTSEHDLKSQVRDFWNSHACGESYAVGSDLRERLDAQEKKRYELEPYIFDFARFHDGKDRDVLEVGVGMGSDHLQWARSSPKSLTGIDLTPAAVNFTRERLAAYGLHSDLRESDAENLPFPDNSFDLVYSNGVLHASPDTPRAVKEVCRVLRPGGIARIMIYHRYSIVGYLLWVRYALLRGRPWLGLTKIYADYLESPGTKCYTVAEAQEMCRDFSSAYVRTLLSFGDLLQGNVGERRHKSLMLTIARKIWPRWFIRAFFKKHGLILQIDAVK